MEHEITAVMKARIEAKMKTFNELITQCASGGLIADEMLDIACMLLEKNKAYGNSALDPMRVFSRASNTEQIRVRLDDKLSRLKRGAELNEDVVFDLIGYLVLLRISIVQDRAKRDV